MPFSNDTERLVLGTIMSQRGALDEIRDVISPNLFYVNLNKLVYTVITELDSKGKRPDVIAVMDLMRGRVEDTELWRVAEIAGFNCFDVRQHAIALYELSMRRKFYEIGCYLMSHTHSSEDVSEVLNKSTSDLGKLILSDSSNISTLQDAVNDVYEAINFNLSHNGDTLGSPTGFSALDAKGGLLPSNLIVIAADSSQGKTSFAVNLCENAAVSGAKIAFFSLEMTKKELAGRMLAAKTGIPSNEILYQPLSNGAIDSIDKQSGPLCDLNIYFDDKSSAGIDYILSSIRSLKNKYGIDGVILDYLQILNVNMKGVNKEQQMGDVARRLKNIAVELDIWVIALSQLSRDRSDPTPSISRMRDSGQINEAADVTILIYRPEYYGKKYSEPYSNVSTVNTALIDVAKGRNIGVFRFICGFDKRTTRFYDLVTIPQLNGSVDGGTDKMPW